MESSYVVVVVFGGEVGSFLNNYWRNKSILGNDDP